MLRASTTLRLLTSGLIVVTTASAAVDVHAGGPKPASPAAVSTAAIDTSLDEVSPIPPPVVYEAPLPRSTEALAATIQQLVAGSGAAVGVTLVELSGSQPLAWSSNGGALFTAASTYKLAALMLEAENIASGQTNPQGLVCFTDDDYEDGWFSDYVDGACYTRNELASRAAQQSDNTAGHMLVRDVGGGDVLNAWAASVGATASTLYVDPNTTTSIDLATLWGAEAQGRLGGAAAQAWLYPLLTNTLFESGIPAGVGNGATVVHKTGSLDATENDAALVLGAPAGAYVLTVMTDGLDATDGRSLIAAISSAIWQFEQART